MSRIVNIAEGKKNFSRLIQDAFRNKEEIIIAKRGRPVAVIVPYEEYKQSRRLAGYNKILEAREIFQKTGISAESVYIESRKQLEGKL